MQCGLLRDVLAHAIPFQRRLATDMEAGDLLFKHDETRVWRQRLAGPAIYASSKPLQPSGAGVVNREIGRDPHLGELR